MKKILLCSFLFSLITVNSLCQGLRNKNWCFINFNKISFLPPNNPVVSNSAMTSLDVYGNGCGSVSDPDGNLLFYTNGDKVWNKDNGLMPNGFAVGAGSFPGISGQQSCVIVPKPGSSKLYYIFTVCFNDPTGLIPRDKGLHYTVVDMNLNNGLGDVVQSRKAIPLRNHLGSLLDFNWQTQHDYNIKGARITSSMHADGDKIWLVFFGSFRGEGPIERFCFSYLISETGINGTPDGQSPLPSSFDLLDNNNYPYSTQLPSESELLGTLKISPNSQFACDVTGDAVNLYNFNNMNGHVSFNQTVYSGLPGFTNSGYGVEFSPDSGFLYFTAYHAAYQSKANSEFPNRSNTERFGDRMKIYQFKIGSRKPYITEVGDFSLPLITQAPSVNNSLYELPGGIITPLGALQLSVYGKVYVCSTAPNTGFGTVLGVINTPNTAGIGCNFDPTGVFLNPINPHELDLPQWVHSTQLPDPQPWPKAYPGRAAHALLKNPAGGVYVHWAQFLPSYLPNVNHNGVLPPTPVSSNHIFKYTSNGETPWVSETEIPNFVFQDGKIQVISNWNSNSYTIFNGNTGNPIPSISYLPSDEKVLAETLNGDLVTLDFTGNLRIRNSQQSSSPLSTNNVFQNRVKTIFNRSSNKLYFFVYDLPTASIHFKLFTISNGQVTESLARVLPLGTPFVSNSDNLYLLTNEDTYSRGNLVNVDYSSQVPEITLANITNLPNGNNFLEAATSNDPYSSDRLLVQRTETLNNPYNIYVPDYLGQVFVVNLADLSSKRLEVLNFKIDHYLFENNFVYLSSALAQQRVSAIQYAGQYIPPITSALQQMMLTKLDLNLHFQREANAYFEATSSNQRAELSNSEALKLSIIPNPVSSTIKIGLPESWKDCQTLLIFDQFMKPLLVKNNYLSNSVIDVSKLLKGVYFVEATNSKKEKIVKSFLIVK
jgi:hypothetical protein